MNAWASPIPGTLQHGRVASCTVWARVQPNPTNQHIYVATAIGTSGGSALFPTAPGATVTDGTVVWTEWTQEGVWTWPLGSGPIGGTPIDYDVDTDNDGVPDARYMDFGFPLMQDSNGNQFVALGAVKIIDADSLFNLNVHGNRAATAQLPVSTNFANGTTGMSGIPSFLSQSDHGVSASEVNPEWALNARPVAGSADFPGGTLSAALQQYVLFFRPGGSGGNPTNNFDNSTPPVSYELANMEMWNLLNGRPQLSTGPAVSGSSFAGRWGENLSRLDPQVTAIIGGATLSAGVAIAADPFPLPGTSGFDDNSNSLEGGSFADDQKVYHPAFVQPIDFFTAGTWIDSTIPQGKRRLLYPYQTATTVAGNEQFPQYQQFWINETTSSGVYQGVQWANFLTAAVPGPLTPSGGSKQLVDEPDETFTEPSAAAQQPNDSIFGASENAIQLSGQDFTTLGSPGRTPSLMPFNFVSNARAALIRQRFTSTSWDLKSFGKEFLGPDLTGGAGPWDARRLWEFSDLSGATPPTGPFRFPPNFGTTPLYTVPTAPFTTSDDGKSSVSPGTNPTAVYPLRTAVANLVQILANPNQASWVANTPYIVGAVLTPTPVNGQAYRCTSAGTSGANQPVWPTSAGNTVTDGTVTWTDIGQSFVGVPLPQRLLSVNGLTEMYRYNNESDSNGNPVYRFRFRPLTPHPSANPAATGSNVFLNTAITPFPPASQSITYPTVTFITEPEQLGISATPPTQTYMQQQEWLARYDRQRMARDIYTLLYLMGGGADTQSTTSPYTIPNYATTSNSLNLVTGTRPLYTDDQLQEMAQFAVNVVDALGFRQQRHGLRVRQEPGRRLEPRRQRLRRDRHDSGQRPRRGVRRRGAAALPQRGDGHAVANLHEHEPRHPDGCRPSRYAVGRHEGLGFPVHGVGERRGDGGQLQQRAVANRRQAVAHFDDPFDLLRLRQRHARVLRGNAAHLDGRDAQAGSSLPTVAAGTSTGGISPRLTIGGMAGSATGVSPFTIANNTNPTTATPHPSFMVIDPNDTTGTVGNILANFDYQFPIAPRAAYGTGATTATSPWFGSTTGAATLTAAQSGLDLADPSQNSNYWLVPPNSTTPSADGTVVTAPPGMGAGAGLAVQRSDRADSAEHGTRRVADRAQAAGRLESGGHCAERHQPVGRGGRQSVDRGRLHGRAGGSAGAQDHQHQPHPAD